jgi:hypothetical protein
MRSLYLRQIHPAAAPVYVAPLGPMAAPLAIGASVLSAGMTVLGGISSANAQRQQGEAEYQNALYRQQQAEQQAELLQQQAQQQRVAAGQEQAASQRQAIEAKRKGDILASRARAVMAASGGGVDEKLVASLIGEGDYGKDMALYQGDERARTLNNRAAVTDFQAAAARYGGATGVGMAGVDRSILDNRADATIIGGVAQAGLGLANKYGGEDTEKFIARSPTDTMATYRNLPVSQQAVGFDNDWNPLA